MIYLLYFESILLLYQVISRELYKSSIAILYLFVINTFVSPVVYYDLLNGESYITFSESNFEKYVVIGCIYIAWILALNMFMKNSKIIRLKYVRLVVNSPKTIKYVSRGIMGICLLYIVIYGNYFPLIQQIFHHSIMNLLDRPDVSGNIPFYFTMSTVMCSFFPMYFLFDKERRHNPKDIKYNLVWYAIIAFIMLVGGNKGIIVYFAIFIWIYIWKMRVDWRIILVGVLLLYVYEVTIYGSEMMLNRQLLEGLVSPLRRFFVTQGAMFINRIPIIEAGTNLSDTYISAYVYTRVYGGMGGSAPTYFIGDLMIKYGYVVGMIIGMIATVLIFVFSKYIDNLKGRKLYKYWGQFYLLYLVGNSAISSSFLIRAVIVLALSGMLSLVDRSKEDSDVVYS